MPVFRALGFGILLIILQLLAPKVLSQGQEAVISFLKGAEVSANVATSLAASTGSSITQSHAASSQPATPDLALPRTPSIQRF